MGFNRRMGRRRGGGMEADLDVFTSAAEFLRHHRPERPILALRPACR